MFSVIMGAMGLGSAFPCIAAIMQGKAAAETILYVIDRVPAIDSASEQGRQLKHEEVK
jgi:ATP-binding cassette subfamily B (MDR/TAP) protein 1